MHTADHFSGCAMQRKTPIFASKLLALSLGTSEFYNSTIKNNEAVSEDCLYLNVWTGSKSTNEHRPVIVFIHGGSFLTGAGSIDAYNGEAITKGLFQRSIGESGAILGSRGISGGLTQTLAQAEQAGMKFADSQKKASISDLRKMSSSYLLKVSKNLTTYVIKKIILSLY